MYTPERGHGLESQEHKCPMSSQSEDKTLPAHGLASLNPWHFRKGFQDNGCSGGHPFLIWSSPEEDWSHGMRTAILLDGNSSLTALQSRLSTRFSKARGQTRLPSVEFQQEIVEEECQYCRSDSL